MDVAARPAGVDDAPELAELEEIARSAVAEHRGGLEWLAGSTTSTPATWAERVAGAGEWWVAVGTIDGVVVGYCAARRAGGVATIDHLFVLEGARGVGVGEALIEEALAWASDLGASVLEATALPGDRETKNLFERFGMKARAITVSRRLA